MAYGVTDIGKVEAWTAANYSADDGALDLDVSTCMLNGTTSEDCDEWKEGTINGRIVIGIPPSAITALAVRFYLNSIMTGADASLLPYTDANSVSVANEIVESYATAGVWVNHVTDAAFRAELGDLGDKCAVRWASNAGAKSKLGEVNIDIAYTQPSLTGVSKDKDGTVLGNSEMALFKVISQGPPTTYEFVAAVMSDGSGNYSFDVWGGIEYAVYLVKDDSPHVFDVTDNVLQADP